MLFKNTIEPKTLELLIKLQSLSILRNFKLVGGTALALQIGHRKSDDIDLFSNKEFDVREVLEYLEQKLDFFSDYTSQNTIRGSIDEVKIDLICHKYPLVKEPIFEDGIYFLSIEDIAAMKLNAIAGNGTRSKDFIDVYFILKRFTLPEILTFYKKKYAQRNVLHVIKSLVYFDEISTGDWPVMIVEKGLTLSDVKRTIEQNVKETSKDFLQ